MTFFDKLQGLPLFIIAGVDETCFGNRKNICYNKKKRTKRRMYMQFEGDEFYDKLFDSLMNINKDQKKEANADEILQNFLDAANRWNKAEAKRAEEEEKRRKDQEEEEKLEDAIELVRTIDDFTSKWYPVAGMTGLMSDEAYETSARALIKMLDMGGGIGGLF